jgi:hypothetical protein
MDVYMEKDDGCELYCEKCATNEMESWPDGGGESDSPQNCANCHMPLDNPLTPDGVNYVIQSVRESLQGGKGTYLIVLPCYQGTYYQDSPQVAIVRDWLRQLEWYHLPQPQSDFVSHAASWIDYQCRKAGFAV